MQRGKGGRDDFVGFGDPFAGFGGFGRPGGLISSSFGGRDPFDDPFFTQPYGNLMGPGMFGPSIFDDRGSFFGQTSNAGFLEQAFPPEPKGPIIKELSSDDEEGDEERTDKMKKDNPRKHSRSSKEPYVQDPDEEEEKSKYMQCRNEFSRPATSQPRARTYTFQSSTVTYGGPNGAYHTSSTTRRNGGDGITVEEHKEADTTTGRATHRLARGIHDRGHSLTRKLNSDGRVDTMQTLHNMNEDELASFEAAWKGNARQHLPGWNPGLDMLHNGNIRNGSRSRSSSRQDERSATGWALPSSERPYDSARMRSQPQTDSFRGQAR